MNNPLIPVVPTVTVWIVSVSAQGNYQPVAVVGSEADAPKLCKLIGMSAPEQKPRRAAGWMPVGNAAVETNRNGQGT